MERRHEPTPGRLRRAAREGDVPYSVDLAQAGTLVAICATLALLARPIGVALQQLMISQLSQAGRETASLDVAMGPVAASLLAAAPLLLAVWAAAWGAHGLQKGIRLHPFRLAHSPWRWPDCFHRLCTQSDVAIAGWLKSAILVFVAGKLLWNELSLLAQMSLWSPSRILAELASVSLRVATGLAVAVTAIGIVDYLWQRWRRRQRLRMTDEELRAEQN